MSDYIDENFELSETDEYQNTGNPTKSRIAQGQLHDWAGHPCNLKVIDTKNSNCI